MAVQGSPYYDGQEFENPDDPSAPPLVWTKKAGFIPKAQFQKGAGGVDQRTFDDARSMAREIDHADGMIRENPGATGFWGGVLGGNPDAKGLLGSLAGGVPGTKSYEITRALAPVQARLRLQNLANLKANSPNGASGMGSLTETEGRMLQSTEGSLDAGMSQAELRRSLANARAATTRTVRGLDPANPYDLGRGDDGEAIPQGALFRGRDGRLYTNTRGAGAPGAAPATRPLPTQPQGRQAAPAASGWSIRRVN